MPLRTNSVQQTAGVASSTNYLNSSLEYEGGRVNANRQLRTNNKKSDEKKLSMVSGQCAPMRRTIPDTTKKLRADHNGIVASSTTALAKRANLAPNSSDREEERNNTETNTESQLDNKVAKRANTGNKTNIEDMNKFEMAEEETIEETEEPSKFAVEEDIEEPAKETIEQPTEEPTEKLMENTVEDVEEEITAPVEEPNEEAIEEQVEKIEQPAEVEQLVNLRKSSLKCNSDEFKDEIPGKSTNRLSIQSPVQSTKDIVEDSGTVKTESTTVTTNGKNNEKLVSSYAYPTPCVPLKIFPCFRGEYPTRHRPVTCVQQWFRKTTDKKGTSTLTICGCPNEEIEDESQAPANSNRITTFTESPFLSIDCSCDENANKTGPAANPPDADIVNNETYKMKFAVYEPQSQAQPQQSYAYITTNNWQPTSQEISCISWQQQSIAQQRMYNDRWQQPRQPYPVNWNMQQMPRPCTCYKRPLDSYRIEPEEPMQQSPMQRVPTQQGARMPSLLMKKPPTQSHPMALPPMPVPRMQGQLMQVPSMSPQVKSMHVLSKPIVQDKSSCCQCRDTDQQSNILMAQLLAQQAQRQITRTQQIIADTEDSLNSRCADYDQGSQRHQDYGIFGQPPQSTNHKYDFQSFRDAHLTTPDQYVMSSSAPPLSETPTSEIFDQTTQQNSLPMQNSGPDKLIQLNYFNKYDNMSSASMAHSADYNIELNSTNCTSSQATAAQPPPSLPVSRSQQVNYNLCPQCIATRCYPASCRKRYAPMHLMMPRWH